MKDLLIILVLLILVGGAIFYIWRSKKRGNKCIGCPNSGCPKCSCKSK